MRRRGQGEAVVDGKVGSTIIIINIIMLTVIIFNVIKAGSTIIIIIITVLSHCVFINITHPVGQVPQFGARV